MTRREWILGAAGVAAISTAGRAHAGPSPSERARSQIYAMVARVERKRILAAADRSLAEQPITVTAARSDRSSGGLHDYFSEGDYWWPDPAHPDGPYVRRDGFSNPANFNAHREALIRFGVLAPALAAAWCLTKDKRYARHFFKHLNAWFVDPATRMNPDLQFAQAIFGVSEGRGVGIIDTLQIIDVARALRVMEAAGGISSDLMAPIRTWFASYVDWMATSANGIEERDARNNHGTCWVLQVAEFAQLAQRPDLSRLCVERFKTSLVPDQIAADGRLPLELARTRPYSYSLFDCDVLTGICQSLSTATDNLWKFKGPRGAGVVEAVTFLYPYLQDKNRWPFAKDVEHFDELPSRRPSLLFTGEATGQRGLIDLWRQLDPNPQDAELIRNLPIRQPLLWADPVFSG